MVAYARSVTAATYDAHGIDVSPAQVSLARAAGWPTKHAPDGPLADRLISLFAVVSRDTKPGDQLLDHRARWWLAAAAQAGLRPAPVPGRSRLSPLRLVAFRRADKQENRP